MNNHQPLRLGSHCYVCDEPSIQLLRTDLQDNFICHNCGMVYTWNEEKSYFYVTDLHRIRLPLYRSYWDETETPLFLVPWNLWELELKIPETWYTWLDDLPRVVKKKYHTIDWSTISRWVQENQR